MSVFKPIDKSSTVIEQNVVQYTHNLTTSSAGIQSINIVSGSINEKYWNSLNVLFYTSGSPAYPNEHNFGRQINNLAISTKYSHGNIKQHLHKFHGYPSSSIITIPNKYYGEKIKQGSFIFTDKSHTDNDNHYPTIKDDGIGNLYSTNAHHSQSNNHASHSDNYVGNIFYEEGIAVITETGSWSGSVNYSDVAKDTNFVIQLDSLNTITTHEYSVTLHPREFNKSMNYTLRMPLSGSYNSLNEYTASVMSNQYIASEFTGSDFTPYITQINLYQNGDYDQPIITAKLPKPIKKSNRISTTFKIKLDF